jgi:hypothetical protein
MSIAGMQKWSGKTLRQHLTDAAHIKVYSRLSFWRIWGSGDDRL